MMDAVELIRREWSDGARRFEEYRDDPRRYSVLVGQLEAVVDELRKQIGQTYTLAELATAYRDAERWARERRIPAYHYFRHWKFRASELEL